MNSERPQNPKSDFPEAFDSDSMEIDVTYEEITPEEQQKIKQGVRDKSSSSDSSSESIADMWLDDDLDVIDVPLESDSEELKAQSGIEDSNDLERESEDLETAENKDSLEPENNDLERESEDLETAENKDSLEPENIESQSSENEIDRDSNNLEAADTLDQLDSENIDSFDSILETEEEEITFDNLETKSISSDKAQIKSTELTSPTASNDLESQELQVDNEDILDESESENDEPELEIEEQVREEILDQTEIETTDLQLSVDNSEKVANGLETESIVETKIEENSFEKTDLAAEKSVTEESQSEPELIADSWLEESEKLSSTSAEQEKQYQDLSSQIAELEQQKTTLVQEIKTLKAQKKSAIAQQAQVIGDSLGRMVKEGTRELKERKNNLLIDIEKLERRRERIRQEMRTSFAGASQDLAVRIQGFKEYLVGSLQDLTTAAERLDLPKPEERRRPPQREARPSREERRPRSTPPQGSSQPQFTEQAFADQTRRIRQLLEQYRTKPDYYGSPWQLRRTFEPVHAEKVQEWFFGQGGRGAIKGMGSRLQNILVASAIISVLYRLYRDRCRILVLVDTPEKLGEWRRGLQDCLGISRNDFGANRGIVLFESADVLVQRADRLLEDKLLPLIIIDETEELVNLSLLKFPLWLAFAEKPQPKTSGYFY